METRQLVHLGTIVLQQLCIMEIQVEEVVAQEVIQVVVMQPLQVVVISQLVVENIYQQHIQAQRQHVLLAVIAHLLRYIMEILVIFSHVVVEKQVQQDHQVQVRVYQVVIHTLRQAQMALLEHIPVKMEQRRLLDAVIVVLMEVRCVMAVFVAPVLHTCVLLFLAATMLPCTATVKTHFLTPTSSVVVASQKQNRVVKESI